MLQSRVPICRYIPEILEKIMKQTYLIATSCAALLAGTMFVAAQGMPKQAPGGDGGAQGQTQREPAPDQRGKQDQREQGRQQGQREQGKQQGTVGQGGEQREQGRDRREQNSQGQQNQPKEKGKAGEAQRERGKNETIGQGQSKDRQGQSKDNQREGQQGQREGQRDEQRGQTREGGSANVTLTTEQRTRVRESVLTKGPRASNVNFSINVGVAVPRSVRIVAVDPILVEYYPRYRGFFYFIVNDQIVIVDKSHKIVAVINV